MDVTGSRFSPVAGFTINGFEISVSVEESYAILFHKSQNT
jgi:hypothetical protein